MGIGTNKGQGNLQQFGSIESKLNQDKIYRIYVSISFFCNMHPEHNGLRQ
jgi:hypothetical protein